MKTIRYAKLEKLKYRKYHIKDLNIIIKLLYPYRQTINKFTRLLNQLTFTAPQQELLITTIHSLTIVNEMYRDQDKWGRLYSTREDVINAIFMLQNELDLQEKSCVLPAATRWFYSQLQIYFSDLDFTSTEVSKKLIKSKSACYRHLTELVDRQLVSVSGKKGQTYLYCLKENVTP